MLKTTTVDTNRMALLQQGPKFWLQVTPTVTEAADRFTAIRHLPGDQIEAEAHFERAIRRAMATVLPEEMDE